MFTAIIADDENKVAQLIKKLVSWDELGMDLIAITHNGSEALELIRKYQPDVVITDIRMPEIDGLELIRQVKELKLGTKFVVISGYRYFEYAHSALKYGVEDYLIKPINKDELNQVLRKITKEKLNDMRNHSNQVLIQDQLHKSRNALHRELVEKLITNKLENNDIQVVNNLYSLNFEGGLFQAITFILDYKNLDERDYLQDNLVMEKLANLIHQALNPYINDSLVATWNEQILCCVMNFQKEQSNKINDEFSSLFSTIENYVYGFNNYEITMGIGSVENLFSNINHSLNSALTGLQYRIVVGTRRKINADHYNYYLSKSGSTLIKKFNNSLNQIIKSFDTIKFCSLIDQAFDEMIEEPMANPSDYYNLAMQLVDSFFNLIQMESNENFVQSKNEMVKTITGIFSVQTLVQQLKERLTIILKNYEEIQLNKDLKPIREAKQYIDENYANKIVLEDIANIVNLNPVYFSVIFKKETGENFIDYLCKVRIEAAKDLLRNEKDKIAVISEKVGYKDAKYFSKIFTKTVGIKPAQYRKLYS